MVDRASISTQFADNLREAEGAIRAIAQCVASIDATVAQTRDVISESRRLLDQADRMQSLYGATYAAGRALTPTVSSAAMRSPAE